MFTADHDGLWAIVGKRGKHSKTAEVMAIGQRTGANAGELIVCCSKTIVMQSTNFQL